MRENPVDCILAGVPGVGQIRFGANVADVGFWLT
jgi:hypothetical protein